MIRLTAYGDGSAVYIQPRTITAIVGIPASVHTLPGSSPREHGSRTRIHFGGHLQLVTESPEEVADLIGKGDAPAVPDTSGPPPGYHRAERLKQLSEDFFRLSNEVAVASSGTDHRQMLAVLCDKLSRLAAVV